MNCPVCAKLNDASARFCRFCGSTLAGRAPESHGLEIQRYPVGKSPIAALFFSFIPGLGQFYNGDFKRGVLAFILAIIALLLIPQTACSSILPLLIVWLWAAGNAYNVAARKTPLWA